MKTITLDADFCVVGGGMAGMCAAIAAGLNLKRRVDNVICCIMKEKQTHISMIFLNLLFRFNRGNVPMIINIRALAASANLFLCGS